jgi:hypothetical protein
MPVLAFIVAAVSVGSGLVLWSGSSEEQLGTLGSPVDNDDPNRAWVDSVAAEKKINPTGQCDIARLKSLSQTEFKSDYYLKKPFILETDLGDHAQAFSRSEMIKSYGNLTVLTGISRDIITLAGTGYHPMDLSEYIESVMTQRKDYGGDTLYLFDRGEFMKEAKGLKNHVVLESTPFKLMSDDALYIAIGAAYSGTQFHHHADGWNLQIYGKKHWLMYPPQKMPPIHYPSIYVGIGRWFDTILPKLEEDEKPMVCTSGPGDVIYVPDGWYHATVNLGESVGVAGQKTNGESELQKLWEKCKKFVAGASPSSDKVRAETQSSKTVSSEQCGCYCYCYSATFLDMLTATITSNITLPRPPCSLAANTAARLVTDENLQRDSGV